MVFSVLRQAAALLLLIIPSVLCQSSNLPAVPPGVFTASTRIEIKTNASAAWNTLLNFPAYPDWNPFVRSVGTKSIYTYFADARNRRAIVLSPLNLTLPDQYPVEGRNLYLRTQTPPLPLPVDSSTADNPLNTQFAYENITHVQHDLLRVAWKYVIDPKLLNAERWQAISDIGDGKVLYESREVFSGVLAAVLRDFEGEGLQKSFDAQGQGLKLFLER